MIKIKWWEERLRKGRKTEATAWKQWSEADYITRAQATGLSADSSLCNDSSLCSFTGHSPAGACAAVAQLQWHQNKLGPSCLRLKSSLNAEARIRI